MQYNATAIINCVVDKIHQKRPVTDPEGGQRVMAPKLMTL